MTEKRYGYHAISPRGHDRDAAAIVKLSNIDRALRAEILSNARKQYEVASRELWLKAQQAAQAEAQVRRPAPAPVPLPRPSQIQEPVHGHSSATEYAPTHAQRQLINELERIPRFPQPPPPRSISSLSPNTTKTIFYHFRRDPKQSSGSMLQDAASSQSEANLGIEELKRRYYAQLNNQAIPSSSSGYTQASYYRAPPRPKTAIGVSPTTIQHGHADGHANTTGQVRTTADEYLDYYMPARRGPHSNPGYHNRQEMPLFRQLPKSVPEEISRGEAKRRFWKYGRDHDQRDELVPGRPVQRAISGIGQQPRVPIQEIQEPVIQSERLKGKLSFLLNPVEPSTSRASPRNKQPDARDSRNSERGTDDRSPAHSSLNDSRRVEEYHDPQVASPRNNRVENGPPSNPHAMEAPEVNIGDRQSSSKTPRDALLASYNRPAKRKASSPPPDSPAQSSTSSKYEAPRAKRRAFSQLPPDYDCDSSQSEPGPEEEETDERYVAEMSGNESNRKANRETRSTGTCRHNIANHATSGNKSSAMNSNLRDGAAHRRPSVNIERDRHRSSKSSTEPDERSSRRTKTERDSDDDEEMDSLHAMEGSKKYGSSNPTASSEESKKYDFRPRAKPHSR